MSRRPTDPLHPIPDSVLAETRRQFFARTAGGIGSVALASMLKAEQTRARKAAVGGLPDLPHFAPKAKRAIYLHMLGAPPQLETFDYKPGLASWFDKDLPESIRNGQRLTTMTSGQARFPIAPSVFKFQQYGQGGAWISELLPYTAKMADDLCFIRSMHTDAINHEPANQLSYTGSMIMGKASMGSWIAYGLGSLNEDLPTFVVLHATHSSPFSNVQAISARLWGAGYLPGKYAGVALRAKGDPVLFLKDSPGIPRALRHEMIEGISALNQRSYDAIGDPEIQTRTQQFEMAFRMQSSIPELTDFSGESEKTYELYGADAKVRGTFANSVLMARRLAERGVRFVQIFHRGWDQHGSLPRDLASQCKDVDQGCYGLIQDLKQRGMLEDTLVIWGGEFGRTIYCQGTLNENDYGRDHHPRCFTIWMAGGGIKPGYVHGETDEMSYNIVENPVHIHELHATILHQLGINHDKLAFKYQGLDQRLTGVEPVRVVQDILA